MLPLFPDYNYIDYILTTCLDVIQTIFVVTDSSVRDVHDQLQLRNAKGKKGYKGGERSESRNIRFFLNSRDRKRVKDGGMTDHPSEFTIH